MKAWVFTLRELPGFCAKEHGIISKLDARLLDAPFMLVTSSKKARAGKTIDALYKNLPCRAPARARAAQVNSRNRR